METTNSYPNLKIKNEYMKQKIMQVVFKKVGKQLSQLVVFTFKWGKIYYIERKGLG